MELWGLLSNVFTPAQTTDGVALDVRLLLPRINQEPAETLTLQLARIAKSSACARDAAPGFCCKHKRPRAPLARIAPEPRSRATKMRPLDDLDYLGDVVDRVAQLQML